MTGELSNERIATGRPVLGGGATPSTPISFCTSFRKLSKWPSWLSSMRVEKPACASAWNRWHWPGAGSYSALCSGWPQAARSTRIAAGPL
ncbi:hypothetical protein D9M68_523790 [compost metagenome]